MCDRFHRTPRTTREAFPDPKDWIEGPDGERGTWWQRQLRYPKPGVSTGVLVMAGSWCAIVVAIVLLWWWLA